MGEGMREPSRVLEIFYILIWIVVMWINMQQFIEMCAHHSAHVYISIFFFFKSKRQEEKGPWHIHHMGLSNQGVGIFSKGSSSFSQMSLGPELGHMRTPSIHHQPMEIEVPWMAETNHDPAPGAGHSIPGTKQGFSYKRRYARAVGWAANSICHNCRQLQGEVKVNPGRDHRSEK